MEDRRTVMRHPRLIRGTACSLILGLACLSGGCGAGPGSEAGSQEPPKYAESLKGQMQKQFAKKGAPARRPGRGL